MWSVKRTLWKGKGASMMESVVIVTVDYVSRMIGGGIGIEMFVFFQQLEDCPLMVILYTRKWNYSRPSLDYHWFVENEIN